MLWRPKRTLLHQTLGSPPESLAQSPEATICEAIRTYQEIFCSSFEAGVDYHAEEAKKRLAGATKVVGHSGLGTALAPTLLEHIEAWPAWCRRSDFCQHVKFPATGVRCSSDDRAAKPLTTKIMFSYKRRPYGVIFINSGVDEENPDDTTERGKVGLIFGGGTVLGLDIERDLAQHHGRWRWQEVFAFAPGDWMKDLIEIAAYIDDHREGDLGTLLNKDALERARKIKL